MFYPAGIVVRNFSHALILLIKPIPGREEMNSAANLIESSAFAAQRSSSEDSLSNLDIKGDQTDTESRFAVIKLSAFDMWAMGVAITISGLFFAWNAGLEAGFGSYIIARFLISLAYIALVFCISELSSGLPFAGK